MATKKSDDSSQQVDPQLVGDNAAQIAERQRRREEATTVDGSETASPEEVDDSTEVRKRESGGSESKSRGESSKS